MRTCVLAELDQTGESQIDLGRLLVRVAAPPRAPEGLGPVVLATAWWLGLFSYKHLDAAEWWRFTLYDNASRFLRASIAVAIVALGAAGYRLLSAVRYRRTAVLC